MAKIPWEPEPGMLNFATGFVVGSQALSLSKNNAWPGAKIWGGISNGFLPREDQSGERQRRIELLRKLFRISGPLHIPAPLEHPLFHGKGVHDKAAIHVAASMLNKPIQTDELCAATLNAFDTIFVAGSPNSSALCAAFIPAGGSVPPRGELVTNASAIPYHVFEGTDSGPIIKSSALMGEERKVRIRGLTSGAIRWFPPHMADEDGRLNTDYLLLSVIPWNESGGRAIFVGGGHGVGTHALKLLLDPHFFPSDDLMKLVADMERLANFQVVFEVSVRHDDTFSMPSGIKVSPQLVPKEVNSIVSLFSKPEKDVCDTVISLLGHKPEEEIPT